MLLILAGVTITMVLGEDGIIAQAKLAVERVKEEEEKAQYELGQLPGQIENWVNGEGATNQNQSTSPSISDTIVTNVTVTPTEATIKVDEQVTLKASIKPEDATNQELTWKAEPQDAVSITTSDGGKTAVVTGKQAQSVTVTVESQADNSKRATATITVQDNAEEISKTENKFIGYYADCRDENGDEGSDGVPDGIIYADLAFDKEGSWGGNASTSQYGAYTINKVDAVYLKEYAIINPEFDGPLGKAPLISRIKKSYSADKKDRFYVMALNDIDNKVMERV